VKTVKNFSVVAKFPEVIGAALTDSSGMLIECAGQMDGEVAGAVHAFTARALSQAGEVLGLSSFERATLVGGKSVCVVVVHENSVLGAEIDPSKPLSVVEKKIWDTITK
jgi:predicted regulator of Ras-like GTPase activity (Roadblock/LC7/MglB family)